jgi:hypothetical protein
MMASFAALIKDAYPDFAARLLAAQSLNLPWEPTPLFTISIEFSAGERRNAKVSAYNSLK